MYLRLLTSAQIRIAPDDFYGFIMNPDTGMQMDVKEFCELFVDPMGKEAGTVKHFYHVFIRGLTGDGKTTFKYLHSLGPCTFMLKLHTLTDAVRMGKWSLWSLIMNLTPPVSLCLFYIGM